MLQASALLFTAGRRAVLCSQQSWHRPVSWRFTSKQVRPYCCCQTPLGITHSFANSGSTRRSSFLCGLSGTASYPHLHQLARAKEFRNSHPGFSYDSAGLWAGRGKNPSAVEQSHRNNPREQAPASQEALECTEHETHYYS